MDGLDWGNPSVRPFQACTMPPDSLTGGIGMTDLRICQWRCIPPVYPKKNISPTISGSSMCLKNFATFAKGLPPFFLMMSWRRCAFFVRLGASTICGYAASDKLIQAGLKMGEYPTMTMFCLLIRKLIYHNFSTKLDSGIYWGVFHQFKQNSLVSLSRSASSPELEQQFGRSCESQETCMVCNSYMLM